MPRAAMQNVQCHKPAYFWDGGCDMRKRAAPRQPNTAKIALTPEVRNVGAVRAKARRQLRNRLRRVSAAGFAAYLRKAMSPIEERGREMRRSVYTVRQCAVGYLYDALGLFSMRFYGRKLLACQLADMLDRADMEQSNNALILATAGLEADPIDESPDLLPNRVEFLRRFARSV